MTPHESLAEDARAIFAAALAAVDPARSLAQALASVTPVGRRVWIVATGKAAPAMAGAALARLDRLGLEAAGGVVATTPPAPALPPLSSVAGDHPLPGPRSFAAAEALAGAARRVRPDDEAWVLVSGGTSSLIAAPVDGLSDEDFLALHRALGRAGLPIDRLNLVRKRFARWGAGRLLAALPAASVRVFCLSDVPGDAPRDIGSGPCEPDPATASQVRDLLAGVGLLARLPGAIAAYLDRVGTERVPETPKPGDPLFDRRTTVVVGSNALARQAAAAKALELGYRPLPDAGVLQGEAREVGQRLGRALIAAGAAGGPVALVRGGETTVTLTTDHGAGGRCQELALAAARILAGRPEPLVLLAAGTDGRDGSTDAAGAIVDTGTWARVGEAGQDAEAALRRHDAYPALDAAGALLRTGATGTNVMDLVVGLARGTQSGGAPAGAR